MPTIILRSGSISSTSTQKLLRWVLKIASSIGELRISGVGVGVGPRKGFVVLENRHYSEYYFFKPIETLQIYPTQIIIIICVFIFN